MEKTLKLIYFFAGLSLQSVQAADISCGLSRYGTELKTDSRTITIRFVRDATSDSVKKDLYILTGAVQMTNLPKYQVPGVEKKVRDDDIDRIDPFLENLSFANDGKFQSWPKKDDTITVSAETKATVIAATVGGKKKMIEGSPSLFNVLKGSMTLKTRATKLFRSSVKLSNRGVTRSWFTSKSDIRMPLPKR